MSSCGTQISLTCLIFVVDTCAQIHIVAASCLVKGICYHREIRVENKCLEFLRKLRSNVVYRGIGVACSSCKPGPGSRIGECVYRLGVVNGKIAIKHISVCGELVVRVEAKNSVAVLVGSCDLCVTLFAILDEIGVKYVHRVVVRKLVVTACRCLKAKLVVHIIGNAACADRRNQLVLFKESKVTAPIGVDAVCKKLVANCLVCVFL